MREYKLVKYRGRYAIAWREGAGTRRRSLGTSDRDEANRRLIALKRAEAAPRDTTTIDGIVAAYFDDQDERGRQTRDARYSWRRARTTFGHLHPHHIDRDLCRIFISDCRADGLSDSYIRGMVNLVSAACHWHDKATPATFEAPPPSPPRDRHLTRDEAARLIAGASAPHIRLWIVLALTTAARAGAILDLTWDRVHIDRRYIDLGAGRGGKRRAKPPINASALGALLEAREAALTDYVIEYAGGPVKSIKRGFATACRQADLKGVTPHTLRHTAAVWMAEAGVPMDEIAQYLGHASSRTTYSVYARFSPNYLQNAAAALELPGSFEPGGTILRRVK